jgi:hypothetical protein
LRSVALVWLEAPVWLFAPPVGRKRGVDDANRSDPFVERGLNRVVPAGAQSHEDDLGTELGSHGIAHVAYIVECIRREFNVLCPLRP